MRSEKEIGCSSASLGHTDAQIDEAQRNIERCLQALDERGEAGLQDELDRIYPPESQPSNEGKSVLTDETLAPHPLALSMLLSVAEYCANQRETAACADEIGLQQELDRIYPNSDLEVVDIEGVDGIRLHVVRLKTPCESIPFSEFTETSE